MSIRRRELIISFAQATRVPNPHGEAGRQICLVDLVG